MSIESAVVERKRIIGRVFAFPHGCFIWESLPYCGTTRFGQWSCYTLSLLFSVLTYSTDFDFFLVCLSMDGYAAEFTNIVPSSGLRRRKPIILFHLSTILSKCRSVSGKFIIYGNPCAFLGIDNVMNTTTNTVFANEWRPCEQNNHMINLYTMITIICVWFKTYYNKHRQMTWINLVQVNWESKSLK